MAILIVEHNGSVEGASLSGRVLIGRRAGNQVVVDHPDVSRIHAWIDTAGRQFCVTDAGSRTGTFVNGQRVTAKVPLKHGDRITLGPAALTFRADAALPAGVAPLDFGPRPDDAVDDGGVLFDCACGAPLWVGARFAGKTGRCRFCGAKVVVPAPPPSARPRPGAFAQPAAAVTTATVAATCGACQTGISVGEEVTACPACGLTFHANCWVENYGCSAYGCSQVNVLQPKTALAETAPAGDTQAEPAAASAAAAAGAAGEDAPDSTGDGVPREYLLLAGSVIGLVAGILTFGVPALVALVAALLSLRRKAGLRHRGVAVAAALLSLVGVAAGLAVSYIWWLGDGSGPT